MTIVEDDDDPRDDEDRVGDVMRRLRAGPRWQRVFLGALLAAAAGGVAFEAAGQFGLGPLAPTAPRSWVYVATSRSVDEPARDITAIDVSTGERRAFSIRERVLDMALSRDRRRLFVASDDGRVLVFDAVSGGRVGVIRSSSHGLVEHLAVLDDGRLLTVVDSAPGSALVVLDPARDGDQERLELPRQLAGRPAVGTTIFVPVAPIAEIAGGRSLTQSAVLTASLAPLAITNETAIIPKRSPSFTVLTIGLTFEPPILLVSAGGTPLDFDPATLVAARIGHEGVTLVDLAALIPRLTERGTPIADRSGDAALTRDGRILHVCLGGGPGPTPLPAVRIRYVIPVDTLSPAEAGDECGSFAVAADGTLVLATGDRVEVLDAQSGAVRLVLRLDGYAVRATGGAGGD